MASVGLSATQRKLFAAWETLATSEVTKALANAARKTGVAKISSITLKPIGAYLSAMDRAFVAGMDGVDNLAKGSKVAAGAKIADEALEVNRGLVVESSSDASKSAAAVQSPEVTVSGGADPLIRSRPEAASVTIKVDDVVDVQKYRIDPEYVDLFKGPQLYKGHHEELGTVIRELENVTPRMTKEQIRKKIQDTLNSCSL
jgi:hypothetical protein